MDNAALFAKVFILTYISVFQRLFVCFFQKPSCIVLYGITVEDYIFNKIVNYCSFLSCIILLWKHYNSVDYIHCRIKYIF